MLFTLPGGFFEGGGLYRGGEGLIRIFKLIYVFPSEQHSLKASEDGSGRRTSAANLPMIDEVRISSG